MLLKKKRVEEKKISQNINHIRNIFLPDMLEEKKDYLSLRI